MVIADRTGKEVLRILRAQLQHHLGAAQVILILVVQEFSFGHEIAVQFSRNLEYRYRTFRQIAVDANTDSGFEWVSYCQLVTMLKGTVQWAKRILPVSTSICAGLA